MKAAAKNVIKACESLEGDQKYSPKQIEQWLMHKMQPAIDELRQQLKRDLEADNTKPNLQTVCLNLAKDITFGQVIDIKIAIEEVGEYSGDRSFGYMQQFYDCLDTTLFNLVLEHAAEHEQVYRNRALLGRQIIQDLVNNRSKKAC